MKLPIKTRILEYAIDLDKPFTAKEISDVMKKEYAGEKTSEPKNIERLLNTYCGVGVMDDVDVVFGENDQLIVTYQVTYFGKKYEKYIPGH